MSETLLISNGEEPDEIESDLPSTVAPPQGMTITPKDRAAARKALKASGMTTLHLPQLEADSELGKYFVKLGLFQIAAKEWVVAGKDLESTFRVIEEIDGKLTDPEARAELMRSRVEAMKQRLELIRTGFKAGELQLQQQTNNGPRNVPFPANCPVALSVSAPGGTVTVS